MVTKAQKKEAGAPILKGMDAIEQFSGFNRAILLRLKAQYPLMPMTKPEHSWMADPDRMRQFLKDYAAGDTEKWLDSEPDPEPEPENGEGKGKEAGEEGDK